MIAGQQAYDIIKHFEGLRLRSYICPAGYPTIGYGSTRDVKMGMAITHDEAIHRLIRDVDETEFGLNKLIKVDLKHNEFDALVSWAYNIGLLKITTSTLIKLLNAKEPYASRELLKWNKARDGKTGLLKPSPGLTRRRYAEKRLFDTGELLLD